MMREGCMYCGEGFTGQRPCVRENYSAHAECFSNAVTGAGPFAPACLLCGTNLADALSIATTARGGIPCLRVCCRSCSLVQQTWRPSEDELTAYYASGSYRAQHGALPMQTPEGLAYPGTPEHEAAHERRAETKAEMLVQSLELKAGDRVLELGAGDGRIAAALRQRGIDVRVYEPDMTMEAEIAKRGVPFVNGEDDFDALYAIHVLEHQRDPVRWIRERWGPRLKLGAPVFFEVPNVLDPYGTIEWFFQKAHLVDFSPRTLAMCIRRAGLEHVDIAIEKNVLYGRAFWTQQSETSWAEVDETVPRESAADVAAALAEYHRRQTESPGAYLSAWLDGVPAEALDEVLLRSEVHRLLGAVDRSRSDLLRIIEKLGDELDAKATAWDGDPWVRGFQHGQAHASWRARVLLEHSANGLVVEGSKP